EINFARDVLDSAEIFIRYEGYLKKNAEQIARAKKYEDKLLSEDIDYSKIEGLRLEAREKLNKVKPRSLGQASRISGVNPADIAVLTVWLSLKK
ncbi:MAG: tRNA uridine-5-carboxymethylaminomethyl(34) synthesis enzyme MnmG, partial [Clostridia bacterium]|nr:tRNA uridine-5-carboxymethylaminomethyl(34) synthesis enzyme MnmG [Clostridia bacterium]